MRTVAALLIAGFLFLPLPVPTGAAAVAGLSAALLVERVTFVSPSSLLDHPVRRALYERILARVGVSQQQVTAELGLSPTNAIWHLRKLEAVGLIRARRFGGATVFYAVEGGVARQRMGLCVTTLDNPNARALCEILAESPGSRQRELGRALDVNHGTVRWHLKKLKAVGAVEERRDEKGPHYHLTDEGREALQQVARSVAPAPARREPLALVR